MQKILIFAFILFNFQYGISQSKKIERVEYNGGEYLLYPDSQKLDEPNSMLSYWKGYIIRKNYKLKKNDKIDGKWIQFYQSNQEIPAKIFNLKNRKIEGEYQAFYANGKLESRANYSQEEITDLSMSWYRNGNVKDSIIYRLDTVQNGHVFSNKAFGILYYESGLVKRVEFYGKNGVKTSNRKIYYKSGQILLSENFSSDIDLGNTVNTNRYEYRTGSCTYYHDNGQIKFQLEYDNDEIIDGEYCEYYSNGMKKQCGNLESGLKVGEWREWFENGELKSIGKYKNRDYIFCGVVPFDSFYEYKVGEWQYFYDNGNLKCRGIYELGKKNIRTNCEGGADLYCGIFTNEWKTYDKNGKLITIEKLLDSGLIEDKELSLHRFYEIDWVKIINDLD